jgi:hypothetical protein
MKKEKSDEIRWAGMLSNKDYWQSSAKKVEQMKCNYYHGARSVHQSKVSFSSMARCVLLVEGEGVASS